MPPLAALTTAVPMLRAVPMPAETIGATRLKP